MIDIAKIAEAARADASRTKDLQTTVRILKETITPQTFHVETELRCIPDGYVAAFEIDAYIHSIWSEIQNAVYMRAQSELSEIMRRYEVFDRASKTL